MNDFDLKCLRSLVVESRIDRVGNEKEKCE